MKVLKGIGLFFIYPLLMMAIGMYAGVSLAHFFYPGDISHPAQENKAENLEVEQVADGSFDNISEVPEVSVEDLPKETTVITEVVNAEDVLNADTIYVLEETDVLTNSVVETEVNLPEKYFGMNREQFVEAMEQYEAFPPLMEMERGFVGLDVLSFSPERVVVRMNYQYVQPSAYFYLAVENNEVVVLLEDRETVYIYTGIRLEDLPEDVQMDIIQMRFIEGEEKLFNFLEAYSS